MRLRVSPSLISLVLTLASRQPLVAGGADASALPKAAEVLATAERVANWQLAHPSAHPATDWTCATFDAGVMALAAMSEQPRYLDAMEKMGEAAHWELGPRPYDADDHCIGQTYAELFLRRHDPRMILPLQQRFDWILAHPRDNRLDFDPARNPRARDRWSWCDSLFMGPPTWMRLFAATGDPRYLDFVTREWWVTSDFLFDKEEHLFYRDSTYFHRREPNGRKVFWSRGNGWVLAGLVRVLQFLPADQPTRGRFVRQFQEMSASILRCQPPDGLWRASLLDPADYRQPETSGSGFHCYALAWGVNNGLLDRALFEPAIIKAWRRLTDYVSPDGRLSHVQPVGADPRAFDPDSTDVFGVGAFLLAASEVHRLVAERIRD